MAIQALSFPPELGALLFSYEIPAELHEIHWHDCLEVGLIESGKGVFYIEGKAFPFEAGDLFLINRLEGHRAHHKGSAGSRARFIYIGDLLLGELRAQVPEADFWRLFSLGGPSFSNQFQNAEVARALKSAVTEWEGRHALRLPMVRAEVLRLLLLLLRHFEKQLGPHSPDDFTAKIPLVLNYIQQNLTEDLGARALSGRCGFSEAHFRKRFKEVFGKTPRHFVEERRLFHARMLLEAKGRSAKEAAALSGFGDYSAFQRRFKMRFGPPLPKTRSK